MQNEKWRDNHIQFPRLLAEILATPAITSAVMKELCESMDLTPGEVDELFDRAQLNWERIKQNKKPLRYSKKD